jgi:hypothetical protein
MEMVGASSTFLNHPNSKVGCLTSITREGVIHQIITNKMFMTIGVGHRSYLNQQKANRKYKIKLHIMYCRGGKPLVAINIII